MSDLAQKRRVPRQERSRRRVEQILDATGRLVLADGVDALTTRSIADAADVPVASLYQYFSDKEDILLALIDRDMADLDEQLLRDLGSVTDLAVPQIVDTIMRAFIQVYARRPALVEVWLRGRTNPVLRQRGAEHNEQIAQTLFQFAQASGLLTSDSVAVARLAVETGDRIFQLAYAEDPAGDPAILEEGIVMLTAYLERRTT